jgi:predicted aldo/keto reductase-like oxidoreductase
MEKRRMESLGKEVSLLGFGCMRLPLLDPEKQDIDCARAEAMIDRAVARGVNYFDTAWIYHQGMSETFIGRALKKHPRGEVYLATKMPTWEVRAPGDVERIFAEQLKKCQVEYFDFYLIHGLRKELYPRVSEAGIYDVLRRKKEQGLIRHLGFSFHDHLDLLQRILDDHAWDFAQIQLNYVDWEACNARGLYALLEARRIPVVVMEPVRGGALASLNAEAAGLLRRADPSASPASWAIRFAASLPGVMTVLSGMSTMEQVEDNLKTMEGFRPLSETEREVLAGATSAYLASGAIPCTGCRYCMDCPSGVDIPRVFAIYNHYCTTTVNRRMVFDLTYRTLLDSEKAHNCVACGACMEHCPQGIGIPDHMAQIAEFSAQEAAG